MTFGEIVTLLRERRLESTEEALFRAVDEEALALRDPKRRDTIAYSRTRHEDAREFFAEDITRFLVEPQALVPESILAHRQRYVVAWAVAEILRRQP